MTSDKATGLTRRDALGMLGATVAASSLASPPLAIAQNTTRSGGPTAAAQPDEYLLRGGQVLSLDATLGELPRGDVHIRRGAIMAVAERINAPTATVIDATNMIVMPGFVETHWHMWNSIWRGMADDATDYFRLQALRAHYTDAGPLHGRDVCGAGGDQLRRHDLPQLGPWRAQLCGCRSRDAGARRGRSSCAHGLRRRHGRGSDQRRGPATGARLD